MPQSDLKGWWFLPDDLFHLEWIVVLSCSVRPSFDSWYYCNSVHPRTVFSQSKNPPAAPALGAAVPQVLWLDPKHWRKDAVTSICAPWSPASEKRCAAAFRHSPGRVLSSEKNMQLQRRWNDVSSRPIRRCGSRTWLKHPPKQGLNVARCIGPLVSLGASEPLFPLWNAQSK